VRIPLMHPADPASLEADYVTVSVAEGVIQIDRPRFWGSDVIVIDGWILSEQNRLSAMTFEGRLTYLLDEERNQSIGNHSVG
jgi:hypothetical protein